MVGKISLWAQGIIIAVIITTILQIIVPENKNKKYIKVVIGIYVLFCIINPVIGNSLNLDNYNLNQYITINETKNENTNNYDNNVRKMFNKKVKSSIKQELNERGYDTNNIQITTDESYNITAITISDAIEYKQNESIVNRVEISIKDKPAKGIPNSDKEQIKQHIVNTYKVDEKNIIIN